MGKSSAPPPQFGAGPGGPSPFAAPPGLSGFQQNPYSGLGGLGMSGQPSAAAPPAGQSPFAQMPGRPGAPPMGPSTGGIVIPNGGVRPDLAAQLGMARMMRHPDLRGGLDAQETAAPGVAGAPPPGFAGPWSTWRG